MILRDKFLSVVGTSDLTKKQWSEIEAAYAEPQRFYHTMTHIEAGYSEWVHMFGPNAVGDTDFLAWMYHDVIYEPRSDSNERDSANFFMEHQRARKGDVAQGFNVAEEIMLTTHSGNLDSIITDIDLTILGKPWEEYCVYSEAIRKEYSFLDSAVFNEGRATILKKILDRPWIYFNGKIRGKYEDQARDNLAREIDALVLGQN